MQSRGTPLLDNVLKVGHFFLFSSINDIAVTGIDAGLTIDADADTEVVGYKLLLVGSETIGVLSTGIGGDNICEKSILATFSTSAVSGNVPFVVPDVDTDAPFDAPFDADSDANAPFAVVDTGLTASVSDADSPGIVADSVFTVPAPGANADAVSDAVPGANADVPGAGTDADADDDDDANAVSVADSVTGTTSNSLDSIFISSAVGKFFTSLSYCVNSGMNLPVKYLPGILLYTVSLSKFFATKSNEIKISNSSTGLYLNASAFIYDLLYIYNKPVILLL